MQDLSAYATDKAFLRSLVEQDYQLPDNIEPFALALALLPNFGSSDGELRDELSYMIFANGLIARQKLLPEHLEQLLRLAIDDEHLFYCIDEQGSDAVFMRSFSNLMIAAILYSDAKNPALPSDLIHQTRDALLRYARTEKDWRGYVEGKGWAHAMAHLADALDECAQHREMDMEERKEILKIVAELASLEIPLHHEEDVRLAIVAYHIILAKQVSEEFLTMWVNACFIPRDSDIDSWTRVTNTKNFLRSLYFLLFWESIAPVLTQRISSILKQQDEIYLGRQ